MREPSFETLLAFDVGVKRTGVAVGQTKSRTAKTAGQLLLKNGRFNWPEVDKLIFDWQPDRVIVGDPRSDDPHLKKVINRLKSHIQQTHKLRIVDVDETLSSAAANSQLQDLGYNRSQKTRLRDAWAACLILESYYTSLG